MLSLARSRLFCTPNFGLLPGNLADCTPVSANKRHHAQSTACKAASSRHNPRQPSGAAAGWLLVLPAACRREAQCELKTAYIAELER